MHRFEDPRVDVAVYFIAPHRLKQMDCEFMSELAKCVPVLPVLAKVRSYVNPPTLPRGTDPVSDPHPSVDHYTRSRP
jgi:hypothetical protein